MAQKVIVTLADDMDGTEGDDIKPIHFALEKSQFKMDLSAKNRLRLREALAPFIEHAQPADAEYRRQMAPKGTGVQRTRPAGRSPESRERAAAIREWARGKGYIISARGRIPRQMEEEYHEEHRTSL